ncbi:MAG TPA: ornithine cyclodeaminase family protein [Candidatus Dormibacteraeota bacterium]|nr:ornithine cyclodeaminase family protein [Candidatus Dormibacteraeota bacterium]
MSDPGRSLRFLTQADVVRLLDLDRLLESLAAAFVELSAGRASVPPRIAARTASGGLLGAMPGYMSGVLEAKVVSVFPQNHVRGLPSHQGLIALFDEGTGAPLAVMDGVAITAIRTGASAAVAARWLARPEATTLAILGAGVQGRSHFAAFPRVRDFKEIRIASRNAATAQALAAESPRARAVATFKEAVQGADMVCCCTDAREPVMKYEWLAPGAHVSSVGGTFGPELDAQTIGAGMIFVESREAVRQPPPAGAHELQGLRPESVTEMGEVIAGTQPGRTRPDQLTVYKSSGHAVEDAAAAQLVYERAVAEGAGQLVSL